MSELPTSALVQQQDLQGPSSVQQLDEALRADLDRLTGFLIGVGLMRPAEWSKREPWRVLHDPTKDITAIRLRVLQAHQRAVLLAQQAGEPTPELEMTDGGEKAERSMCGKDHQWVWITVCSECEGTGTTGKRKPVSCLGCIGTGKARGPVEQTCTRCQAVRSVATERRILKESGDAALKELAEAGECEKILGYLPMLYHALTTSLTVGYRSLLETGRATATMGLNNPPRGGRKGIARRLHAPEVRECFVARAGHYYIFCDYDSAELRGLAQVQRDYLGSSRLGDLLDAGKDPHLSFGARLLGIEYEDAKRRKSEDAVKEGRQYGKIFNFGKPGGLGNTTMVAYARNYEIEMTVAQAKDLAKLWFVEFPDMRDYFAFVDRQIDKVTGEGTCIHPRSCRVRGRVRYTSFCNGYFQGIVADGAKRALWLVTRECFLGDWTVPTTRFEAERAAGGKSPLYGSHPCVFLHDEIICESPAGKADAAARRLSEVMLAALREFIPDVSLAAKPVIARRWYKGAESLEINGELVPVRPNPVPAPPDGTPERKAWRAWIHDTDGKLTLPLTEKKHIAAPVSIAEIKPTAVPT